MLFKVSKWRNKLWTAGWYLQVVYLWQRCKGIEWISSRDMTISRWRRWSVGCRRTRRPVTGLASANTDSTSITYGSTATRPRLIAFNTRPLSVTSNQHNDKVVFSWWNQQAASSPAVKETSTTSFGMACRRLYPMTVHPAQRLQTTLYPPPSLFSYRLRHRQALLP